ncbi:MAG: hypothetical protein H0V24_08110 [Chloroflexia bacterium]|nr:hypothetical protein [Chloroflexia bacterium]
MGQTADQLRQEIDHKRDDAAAKIDEIETRVQDTAEMAKDTVDQTMQAAKDTVDQTMQAAKDTVTESVDTVKQSIEDFDLQKQIDERPLVALGAAALGGFLLAGVMSGQKQQRYSGGQYDSSHHTAYGGMQPASRRSGVEDTISAMTGVLMGMATDRLQGIVEETFPEFGHRLRQQMPQPQPTTPTVPRNGDPATSWPSATRSAEPVVAESRR